MKKKNVNLAPAEDDPPCGRGSLSNKLTDVNLLSVRGRQILLSKGAIATEAKLDTRLNLGYVISNVVRKLSLRVLVRSTILGLLILALNISPAFADPKGVNIFEYPRDLPNARIYDKYGKAFSLKDFSGQFLIVIFWSKNCAPCLSEMKTLEAFQEKTKFDGIKLIVVSNEREWNSVKEYKKILKRYNGQNLDAYTDRNGDLMSAFGIHSFPNTVLVNSKSLEIGRIRGSADWSDADIIEHIYKIKAENNSRGHVNPNIGIKSIKVEEL